MREQSKEKWEYQFKRWLMTEGIQINRKSQSVYSKEGIARNPNISYLLRMVDFTCPNIWEDETEKRYLGVGETSHRDKKTIRSRK